jgi:polysaccharide biosynthesis protein PslG
MTQRSDLDPRGESPGPRPGKGTIALVTVLGGAILLALLFVVAAAVIGLQDRAQPTPSLRATARPTFTSVALLPSDTPLPPTETVEPGPPLETPQATDSPAIVPTVESPPAQAPTVEAPTAAPPTSRPPSGPVTMASPDYGIQAFLWWRPEVAHRDLSLIQDAGFTWVKQWFAWGDIEGQGKGKYDWSTSDRIVDQVEEFGLKLIVRVDHGPAWAGAPPDNIDQFTAFLSAMANRYTGRIHAYQVWNEPNLAREWGNKAPNAAEYTQMLKKAYQAIKAADPNALVITAGMAPTTELSQRAVPDTRFIQAMYEAGAKPYFDVLGAHGAGYKAPPEMDPGQVANDPNYYNVGDVNCPGDACRIYCFRHVEDLRQIMVNNGDAGKKVIVLEFGWTRDERTNSPYYWHRVADQFVQGDYMVRAYKYAKENWQPWIGVMSLIYMPDAQWTENDEMFWWSVIEPSQIDQLFLKAPYVLLCSYIRSERGLGRCPYAPD